MNSLIVGFIAMKKDEVRCLKRHHIQHRAILFGRDAHKQKPEQVRCLPELPHLGLVVTDIISAPPR